MVTYMIDNIASGKVLDVPNHSADNGIQIDQWSDNGGVNQQWELVDAGGGLVKIVNVESKKVLHVRDSKAANGVPVEQWDDHASDPSQTWKVADGGRGLTKFFSALGGNKVLDIPGGNRTDGVGLQIWDDVNAPSEHWALVMTNVKLLNAGSGKVMDLPGFNTSDGTVIAQWEDNGGANQRWRLYPIDSGLYSIGNMASAKFLDIGPGSPASDGPQIVQQPMRQTAMTQRFALKDSGDGAKVIVNAAAGQPIHSSRGSKDNGSVICLIGGGGDPTMGWKLV
ncbi:RICIN domain-containing protein [Nocardia sp. NBC_01503]|uniref:RICIN domain-containing protein n=1 Tax=Nocardia sp. NBC_01503 TaxID=2975997 RepID=UPI002E7AB16C|nr:RICIN domain-containing protein [Nocardia sp. NBC_01503]WTL31125.1 RICIN domain-containing protein [Nocardia sp. NBC_01503]